MKKMLAGLLVVLTLVCAMPLGAFAAEPEDEGVQPLFFFLSVRNAVAYLILKEHGRNTHIITQLYGYMWYAKMATIRVMK